jgi:hypothetical protein
MTSQWVMLKTSRSLLGSVEIPVAFDATAGPPRRSVVGTPTKLGKSSPMNGIYGWDDALY